MDANGPGHRKGILYVRVSTEEQASKGFSLAQQMEALREYAEAEGYEVIEEVADPAQSGASLERPGMDRVRDLVAAGGILALLAQDRDRSARKPAYNYLLQEEFAEYGCELKALNGPPSRKVDRSSRRADGLLGSNTHPQALETTLTGSSTRGYE